MAESPSVQLQRCLDRLQAGDESARQELLRAAGQRLLGLARLMLQDYQRLRRWEDSDDVFQGAMLRLHRRLQQVTPPTVRDFYRLAAWAVRNELIDLARHHYGPEGPAAHHESQAGAADASWVRPPAFERADSEREPVRLAAWTEFHQQVEALPEDEREVFDLVWYQGLKHVEAAELLGVSAKTVRRRWQAACLRLHQTLGDALPRL